MVNIPSFTGFYTSQVVQDFFHQQYESEKLISLMVPRHLQRTDPPNGPEKTRVLSKSWIATCGFRGPLEDLVPIQFLDGMVNENCCYKLPILYIFDYELSNATERLSITMEVLYALEDEFFRLTTWYPFSPSMIMGQRILLQNEGF